MSPRRGPELPYKIVAGVTPCANEWLVATAKIAGGTFAPEEPRLWPTFLEVLDQTPQIACFVVNAPIGLPDSDELVFRTCERLGRELLGARANAINPVPGRSFFESESTSPEGLDAVTMVLMPRFRQVVVEMSPYRQRNVYEGHPELSFYQLNGERPLLYYKYRHEGRLERRKLLTSRLNGIERLIDTEMDGVPEHHLLDAAALLWTARRAFTHSARRLPQDGEWDSTGLRMEYVL